MKSKAQKQSELKEAEALLKESGFLVFVDFSGVSAEALRQLRQDVKEAGGTLVVLKKRLLRVLLGQKGIQFDPKEKFEGSMGTVFATGSLEDISGPIFRFFKGLGETAEAAAESVKKILGGYDLQEKAEVQAAEVLEIGQLPPREELLGFVLGAMVAPVRGFMHIMSERSKQEA